MVAQESQCRRDDDAGKADPEAARWPHCLRRRSNVLRWLGLWGGLLAGLGLAQAAPFAYIPNGGSDNVSVIDTATNTVVATVPVGDLPWL